MASDGLMVFFFLKKKLALFFVYISVNDSQNVFVFVHFFFINFIIKTFDTSALLPF